MGLPAELKAQLIDTLDEVNTAANNGASDHAMAFPTKTQQPAKEECQPEVQERVEQAKMSAQNALAGLGVTVDDNGDEDSKAMAALQLAQEEEELDEAIGVLQDDRGVVKAQSVKANNRRSLVPVGGLNNKSAQDEEEDDEDDEDPFAA